MGSRRFAELMSECIRSNYRNEKNCTGDIETCDPECGTCGERDCPHGETLHYHHDGCPACTTEGGMSKYNPLLDVLRQYCDGAYSYGNVEGRKGAALALAIVVAAQELADAIRTLRPTPPTDTPDRSGT